MVYLPTYMDPMGFHGHARKVLTSLGPFFFRPMIFQLPACPEGRFGLAMVYGQHHRHSYDGLWSRGNSKSRIGPGVIASRAQEHQ